MYVDYSILNDARTSNWFSRSPLVRWLLLRHCNFYSIAPNVGSDCSSRIQVQICSLQILSAMIFWFHAFFIEQQASRYSFENHWCNLEKKFFHEIKILIWVLSFWSHLIFELIYWLNYLFIWQVFYLWDKRVYIKQVPFIKFNVLKMKNRIIKIIRLHKYEKYQTFKRTMTHQSFRDQTLYEYKNSETL